MAENYVVPVQKVVLVKDSAPLRVSRVPLRTSEAAEVVCRRLVAGLPHEEVYVICVSAKMVPRAVMRVAQGGLGGTALKPSDVFRPVILSAQPAFFLTHNHPSGDPKPSSEDIEMTRMLYRACEFVGLTLLDHLVVADEGCVSLRDECPDVFR